MTPWLDLLIAATGPGRNARRSAATALQRRVGSLRKRLLTRSIVVTPYSIESSAGRTRMGSTPR